MVGFALFSSQLSSKLSLKEPSLLMAPIISVVLLLLSIFSTATAQQRNSNISLGSSLSPITNPTSWFSPSGRFAFGFYPLNQGSFTIAIWFPKIPEKTVIWTANRDDLIVPSSVTLQLSSNGGLILRSSQEGDKFITVTSESASSASMLDSGNFVIYNSNSKIIWQSFDYPTNTIVQGQRLVAARGELFSNVSQTDPRKGRFKLNMQRDGNLVQYPAEPPQAVSTSYWNSGTVNAGDNVTVNLDENGHLYLLNGTGFNIGNLSDGAFPSKDTMFYRMTIDIDGILRLYSYNFDQNDNWSIKWNSSNNKCDPTGLCGLNGYCTLMDQEPRCLCPPGFDYIDEAEKTLGCKSNTSAESCKSKDGHIKYTINSLVQTRWEDDSYAVLSTTTEENCSEACMKDCNCEVAIYTNQECRKQKLPLRYGKRNMGESSKVLIKVMSINGFMNDGDPSIAGKENKKELRIDILIVSIVVTTFAFIIIGTTGVLIYRQRVRVYKRISDQVNIGLSEGVSLRSFTYDELEKATDGFKEELGRGSFGTVFKGNLLNSQTEEAIAVKRLDRVSDEGEREFKTEMRVIGRTHHRNLVQLLGYCHEGLNRLLVYQYMSNGSLANFIFSREKCPNWDERVGIALNIARGLLYLHEECETQIIHCDIKPQNILMDEYNGAKIADFGLAKLLKSDQSRTYTCARGTRGYVAPEWFRNMPITVKADVYSFGIVLLEIICCRKNLDMKLVEEEVVLVDWVYDCFESGQEGKLVRDEEVDKNRLVRMVRVALWCIQDEPSLRPSMKKVVLMLEGTIDIPIPPCPTSFLSTI